MSPRSSLHFPDGTVRRAGKGLAVGGDLEGGGLAD